MLDSQSISRILVVLLSFNCVFGVLTENGTDLYFAFMVAKPLDGEPIEQDTSGVVPAVRLALETINNDSSVLNGYRLTHGGVVLNSQCQRTTSLDTFFSDITDTPPNKVFLLGCGCSIATAPVGEISHFWEIVQMSYASLTPVLSDRDSYPNLFSTIPSVMTYKSVIQGLMNTYGWKRLVVVSQLENEFDLLREKLLSMNIGGMEENVREIIFHTEDNVDQIQTLFNLSADYRIYYLNMYQRHARRVLCAAYRRSTEDRISEDIRYPRYLFIVPGTYSERWWTYQENSDDAMNCPDNELMAVLNYSLVIATYPTISDSSMATDVELTYEEFQERYNDELEADSLNSSFAAPFAYDGLWALALSLNNSNLSIPLSDFDNKQNGEAITAKVIENLQSMNFIGLTGRVTFNANGSREQTEPRVLQYRFLPGASINPVLVGRIHDESYPNLTYVNNESNSSVWPIVVPFDGSDLTELRSIVLPIFVILYTMASIGIFIAIGCAIVNFCLRNKKVIRLTSPNLNYLIILGCGLMIISAYFFTYPAFEFDVLYAMCIVRAYTQNIGYILCFGTICAKMWRVYFIFHNPSPSRKRRTIKDWHLFLVVLASVLVMAIVITVSLAVDDYKPVRVKYREDPTGENEYGIRINYETLVCDSDRSIYWIGFVFFLNFLIQAAAVFFAFKTRKVKIKALNDAKVISIIIYVTSVLLTVMLIGALALDNFLNADAALFGSGLVVVPTVVLLMLFIPKWYNLYKDPEGKNIFEGSGQPTFSSMAGGVSDQDYNKMLNRIEELEGRLGKYESVTPFQHRKRVLSSTGDLTHSTNSSIGLLRSGPGGFRGLRSQSYSPGYDVTTSLPTRMQLSPTPVPPLSPLGNGAGPTDSGAGTMTSTQSGSEDDSPEGKKSTVALTIQEEEEPSSFLDSQTPLTMATSNL